MKFESVTAKDLMEEKVTKVTRRYIKQKTLKKVWYIYTSLSTMPYVLMAITRHPTMKVHMFGSVHACLYEDTNTAIRFSETVSPNY
jgi:hypothetical protein